MNYKQRLKHMALSCHPPTNAHVTRGDVECRRAPFPARGATAPRPSVSVVHRRSRRPPERKAQHIGEVATRSKVIEQGWRGGGGGVGMCMCASTSLGPQREQTMCESERQARRYVLTHASDREHHYRSMDSHKQRLLTLTSPKYAA